MIGRTRQCSVLRPTCLPLFHPCPWWAPSSPPATRSAPRSTPTARATNSAPAVAEASEPSMRMTPRKNPIDAMVGSMTNAKTAAMMAGNAPSMPAAICRESTILRPVRETTAALGWARAEFAAVVAMGACAARAVTKRGPETGATRSRPAAAAATIRYGLYSSAPKSQRSAWGRKSPSKSKVFPLQSTLSRISAAVLPVRW